MNTDEIVDAEVLDDGEPGTTIVSLPMSTAALVKPVASAVEAREAVDSYRALCEALLTADDYQHIGRGGDAKRFKKKSAWRKLAVAFGVSVEVVSKDYERGDENRIIRAEVTVKAVAPNGRYMDGLGVCSIHEQRFHGTVQDRSDHDVPSTAMTRAINRACSDLFGLGEVSAEEMSGDSGPHGGQDGTTVQRSSKSVTDRPQDRPASDPQKRMIAARLNGWREGHIAPGQYPEGWHAAGLGKIQNDWTHHDVDVAVKLLESVDRAEGKVAPPSASPGEDEPEAAVARAEPAADPSPPPAPLAQPYTSHGLRDLRAECGRRGIPTEGTKPDVVERLVQDDMLSAAFVDDEAS